jgi:hypothetical protein
VYLRGEQAIGEGRKEWCGGMSGALASGGRDGRYSADVKMMMKSFVSTD